MTPATAFDLLKEVIEAYKSEKPNDRSGADREYQIVITKLEDAYARAFTYIESEKR